MTGSVDEQLSALLDGELPGEQVELLLRRLDRDVRNREKLVRYSLIGELIRGGAPVAPAASLVGRVGRALDAQQQESVHAAPVSGPRWPLFGGGLAAAVLVMAFVGFGRLPTTPPAQPVAADLVVAAPAAATVERPRASLAEKRLTHYLVSHGDYAGSISRQVMNSHVVNQRAEFLVASYPGSTAGD